MSVGPARREPEATTPPPAAPAPGPPGPVAQAPPPAGAPAPAAARRFVMFNFDNADVEVVIQAAAEIVGFNYVIAPAARGRKVTVQTTGRIPSDEVFGVLLTILDVNGLSAVQSGNLYRVIPKEGATQSSVKTVVGNEPDQRIPGDEIVTQIVPLQILGATDAVALLRPFVPQQGNLSAHRDTNLVMITDTAANIRRLLGVLKLADVVVTSDELQIIPIQHADGQELAQLLNQLFATGRVRTGAPAAAPTPAAPPGAPAPPRPPGTPGEAGAAERPLIVAERRSNTVIVQARRQEMETIRRLIRELDVDLYGGQRVFIYFAENAKSKDLVTTLDAIYGRGGAGATPVPTGGPGVAPGAAPAAPRPPSPTGPARIPGVEEGGPLGELRIVADETTNAVIVTAYPRAWKEIESTIKQLDKTPRQVLIEVFAAEVTLTDEFRLGVEWAVRAGRFDLVSAPTGDIQQRPIQNLSPPFMASLADTVMPGFTFFTFATSKFLAALNALASDNKVNVLASPAVMTAENKKAVINVSQSVPVVTSQQVPIGAGGTTGFSVTQSVQYIDAGVILTVTPRIGEMGTVALDVKQEVNQVGENEPPPINSPRILKREAETSIVLLNNQTLVLGGLIQDRKTTLRTGIPFLNRIPVLGFLFGSMSETSEKTELLLLITPRVVGNPVDAARITDDMLRATPGMRGTMMRAPRLSPTSPETTITVPPVVPAPAMPPIPLMPLPPQAPRPE
jgi:general secretion pathway protein D